MAVIYGFSAPYGIIYSVFRFLESEPIVLRTRFYGFLFQRGWMDGWMGGWVGGLQATNIQV